MIGLPCRYLFIGSTDQQRATYGENGSEKNCQRSDPTGEDVFYQMTAEVLWLE